MVSLRCDAEDFLLGLDVDDVGDGDNVTRNVIRSQGKVLAISESLLDSAFDSFDHIG